MKKEYKTSEFGKILQEVGEIVRDIGAIEFLARIAIAVEKEESECMPLPPFDKGREYKNLASIYYKTSFRDVRKEFRKCYPDIDFPYDLVNLRNALAHGVAPKINGDAVEKLIKFSPDEEKKTVKIEYILNFDFETLEEKKNQLRKLRREIGKIVHQPE